jgi:ribosomal protein S18 acetylase RimI-like enzyme
MKSQAEITIRNWTRDDFSIVKNILLTTWKNTYTFIPKEDILSHFEKYYSEDRLIEILNDPFSEGIIAEVNSIPAGWLKLFEDHINKKFFVSSLYVLPEFQGFGLGKKLLNEAYRIAKDRQFSKVWLGVMKQNIKSLEWYRNLGFIFNEEEPFQMGSTQVMHLIGYKII